MTTIATPAPAAQRPQSAWRLTVRRLRRRPDALVGAAIITVFLGVALLAPLLTPFQPGSAEWAALVSPTTVPGPSAEHVLGLDSFGSDLATQLIYGARQSLVIGLSATAIGVTLGATLGVIAGGLGGAIDALIMRFVDILLSIPGLLLAVSIAAIMGKSPFSIMIAIGVSQVPIFARLMRGSMLGERAREYVLAAKSLGLRTRSIVTSQMLPNAIGPVIVQATLVLATATIEVAALSYLGLGTADPTAAEWGRMLVKAQSRLETAPLLAFAPGICIAVTALGFTLLGESLREALDPKGKALK